ncbi:MAG: PIN domain-containing protein [Chloroflexota bacterium]
MQGTFLDTNIFLRHLLNDVPSQSAAAHRLIKALEAGSVRGWTSPLVVAEIVFVLENPKTYHIARPVIAENLLLLLGLAHLRIDHKRLYPRVFELYVTRPIDYVDAYHAALLEHGRQDELYSFDQDFDLIDRLRRRAPA